MSVYIDKNFYQNKHIFYPFDTKLVNPNSYDLTLGDKISKPAWYWKLWRFGWMLHNHNPKKYPRWSKPTTFNTYILKPGQCVLAHSAEYIVIPNNAIGILISKSTVGRKMLEHVHAGLFDSGFEGEATFELVNEGPWPVELKAGMRLMQIVIIDTKGIPEKLYTKTGRYVGQMGPTPARRPRR